MITREIEIDRFTAKSDSGKLCIILVYQQYIGAATIENPQREIPSAKRYATLHGFHVNTIDSETFEIAETQERFKKV
jgi:hypothetical protein